jgi:hypothetical protein
MPVLCSVGRGSPASLGDYMAGPSHVLPTAGTARFAGALTVSDFTKDVHVVTADRAAIERLGPHIVALAEVEGLDAMLIRKDGPGRMAESETPLGQRAPARSDVASLASLPLSPVDVDVRLTPRGSRATTARIHV